MGHPRTQTYIWVKTDQANSTSVRKYAWSNLKSRSRCKALQGKKQKIWWNGYFHSYSINFPSPFNLPKIAWCPCSWWWYRCERQQTLQGKCVQGEVRHTGKIRHNHFKVFYILQLGMKLCKSQWLWKIFSPLHLAHYDCHNNTRKNALLLHKNVLFLTCTRDTC